MRSREHWAMLFDDFSLLERIDLAGIYLSRDNATLFFSLSLDGGGGTVGFLLPSYFPLNLTKQSMPTVNGYNMWLVILWFGSFCLLPYHEGCCSNESIQTTPP